MKTMLIAVAVAAWATAAAAQTNGWWTGGATGAVVRCQVCGGRNVITCPTCRGWKFGPDLETNVACTACSGSGKWKKPEVIVRSGGKMGRSQSVRTGRTLSGPCAECKGTGRKFIRERTYCATCLGAGRIVCPKCKGER